MNQKLQGKDRWGKGKLRPLFCRIHEVLSLSVLLMLLFAAFSAPAARSFVQEDTSSIDDVRITTGTGLIIGENVAKARNDAISKAFSTAVEEYLVQRLGPKVIADNFQRLYEEVLSEPKEQIQDYEVITEFTTDKYVRMLIKARVNTAVLNAILEDMRVDEKEAIQIDVLFLVAEKDKSSSVSAWWADPSVQTSLTLTEIFLSRAFEDKGFRVINRSSFPPEDSYDKGMVQIDLSDENAVKWGRILSAQIVIAGEATITDESRASVYLKALRVADGTTIAQGFRAGQPTGAQGNEENPMDLAVTAWADDMIPYIMDALRPSEAPVNHMIVTFKGLRSYKELHDIKAFFVSNFPEIKSVVEKRLQREFVSVSLKLQGDPRLLARRALNHPQKPFVFDIQKVTDQGFTVVRR